MHLVFGGGVVDRQLADPLTLLADYTEEEGRRYLAYEPITTPDRMVPEDLAVTILLNSRVGYRAFKSVQDFGPSLDLAALPAVSLEATSAQQRDQVAEIISRVAQWPGFAASVATKVLHKKRPALIPILDNQAIFGAYMAPTWPGTHSSQDSVKALPRIRDAIERITTDLVRPENGDAWAALAQAEPPRTRIELFDMVWWVYFRTREPRSPQVA